MDPEKQKLIRLWLFRARRDILSAQKLAKDPDPFLDTAVFFCQQGAEKVVKGLLILHDQFEENTHNVGFLIRQAAKYHPAIISKLTVARSLTTYETEYRYPYSSDDQLQPTPAEFQQALEGAIEIYQAVRDLMPEQIIGQRQNRPKQEPPQPPRRRGQRQ